MRWKRLRIRRKLLQNAAFSCTPHQSPLRATASPQGEALGAPAPKQHIYKSQFSIIQKPNRSHPVPAIAQIPTRCVEDLLRVVRPAVVAVIDHLPGHAQVEGGDDRIPRMVLPGHIDAGQPGFGPICGARQKTRQALLPVPAACWIYGLENWDL